MFCYAHFTLEVMYGNRSSLSSRIHDLKIDASPFQLLLPLPAKCVFFQIRIFKVLAQSHQWDLTLCIIFKYQKVIIWILKSDKGINYK